MKWQQSPHSCGHPYTGSYVHNSFLCGLLKSHHISSISAVFATSQTAQMLPCPQKKTGFNVVLVAGVPVRCSDRNRNLKPFSRGWVTKTCTKPSWCKGTNHRTSARASRVYESALKDTDPVKYKLGKAQVSLPSNSEEKVRELQEESMENSCLALLRNNGTSGCLLQTTVPYKATCTYWTFP